MRWIMVIGPIMDQQAPVLPNKSVNSYGLQFLFLFICLTIYSITPIWTNEYFPTQDGPGHLYCCSVLLQLGNHASPLPEYFFELGSFLSPYWLGHLLILLFMKIAPPLLAEKLFLTLYALIFIISIYYYVESANRQNLPVALFAIPFAFNFIFMMGFYNYALGIPLFFLAIGYTWKHRENLTASRLLLLSVFLLLIYFTHFLALVITCLSISLVGVFALIKNRVKLLQLFAAMIPALALVMHFLLKHRFGGGPHWDSFSLLSYLITLDTLNAFPDTAVLFSYFLAALLWGLALFTIWKLLRPGNGGGKTTGQDIPEKPLQDSPTFTRIFPLFLSFLLLVIYYLLPDRSLVDSMLNVQGGGWTSTRLSIFPVLASLGWISLPRGRGPRQLLLLGLAVAIGAKIHNTNTLIGKASAEIGQYVSGIGAIERDSIVMPIQTGIPQYYNRISPLLHAGALYCINNGSVNLSVEFPDYDYYPINFKMSSRQARPSPLITNNMWNLLHEYGYVIDYAISWKMKKNSPEWRTLSSVFNVCYEKGPLVVFQNRYRHQLPVVKDGG